MRAHVVVQDRTVWLSGGGPLLCVLSVSGAVRKRRSPEPTGHNKLNAGDAMDGNGRSAGEAAEGTGAGHGSDNAGGGDDKRYENDGRDVGRDDDDGATEPSQAATVLSASPPRRRCCGVCPGPRRSGVVATPDGSAVGLVAFVVAAAACVVPSVP